MHNHIIHVYVLTALVIGRKVTDIIAILYLDTEVAAKTPNSDRQEDKSDDRLCCMCDQEVNVRLSPCGHTVMCSDCAHIARRCPTCRVSHYDIL